MAIVDAALIVKALLPSDLQASCQQALADLEHEELLAPHLWAYEVTSALTKAVHFRNLEAGEARGLLEQAGDLGVRLVPPDADQLRRAFEWTLRLSRAAAYDCFYLALAEAEGQELWTADSRLANAVGEPWVKAVAGLR